jgi:hypothetical protein
MSFHQKEKGGNYEKGFGFGILFCGYGQFHRI